MDIVKKLEGNKIALLYPKKLFKHFDKNFNFRTVINTKIYTYSIINPPFLSSEFSIPVNPMFLIYLFKILLQHDVIHMWVPFYISNTLLAILKKLFLYNKKLILTMDTIPAYSFKMGKIMDFFFKIYYRTIGKIVFSASDIITLYGESIKKYTFKAGIPLNKILITPTGVDFFIKKQDRDIRKELKIKMDEKIILFVGLLNHRKGVDIIIKTAQKLKDQKIKIILVGDGSKKRNIKN